MNRYRQYGRLDDQPRVVGDAGFTGLDMLTDPAMLAPGKLAVCENFRFDANGTTVRAGLLRLFQPGTSTTASFGSGLFVPSDGENLLVLVLANALALFDLATLTLSYANYPGTETVTASDPVCLVQGGVGHGTLPQLYLLRGQAKSVLVYDGNLGSISVAPGFSPGDFAIFYADRMAVAAGQDVPVSDFLDFTSFQQLEQFQILKGGHEYLRCLIPYQKNYVLIGTNLGWLIAFFDPTLTFQTGFNYPLSDNSFIQQLTREAGPVGPFAAIEAMGLVWFISSTGIYAFQPQLDNQLVVLGKPLSAPIQPILERLCLDAAQGASIRRFGYRLYFAMPISDAALAVKAVSLTSAGPPYVATLTLAEPHNAAVGDTVLISGATAPVYNAQFPVYSVPSDTQVTIRLPSHTNVTAGNSMYCQRIATRNNCIAVFNLNNKEWESIDWLPQGVAADSMVEAEYGSSRRLIVVDRALGPLLYEQGEEDDIGTVLGGVHLNTNPPLRVPFRLSAANYSTKPIPGRLATRCFRWGSGSDAWSGDLQNQIARKVRQAEVRATLNDNCELSLTLKARTPNHRLWTASRDYAGTDFATADVPLRKTCGERALEAQIEINTHGGRPTLRSFAVEIAEVGREE